MTDKMNDTTFTGVDDGTHVFEAGSSDYFTVAELYEGFKYVADTRPELLEAPLAVRVALYHEDTGEFLGHLAVPIKEMAFTSPEDNDTPDEFTIVVEVPQ